MDIDAKVKQLLARLPEIEEELGNPEVIKDQKRFRALTQEHAYLSELRDVWNVLCDQRQQLSDNKELLKTESDPAFLEMLEEEITELSTQVEEGGKQLELLLVPPDPDDNRNTIIEVRAGTGGDEAALFVGDCVRMYKLYAEKEGWKYEELSCAHSEVGGYKEYIMVLSGPNAYRKMKYEAGTHRVQRVPETETQGRVHTSAITVAVLMEPDEDEEVTLDEKDLRIDTYRASGAGGQHVNTTDSAVRVTHLPTGLVAWCSEEKSQHKNKAKAMRLLLAKIAQEERDRKQKEISDTRAGQVGSGDRSERIRTYNFPQNRCTDHRINLTLYSLEQQINGDLGPVVDALVSHFYQKMLEALGS